MESTRKTRSLTRGESALRLIPETRGLRIRPHPRGKGSWVARSLETAARAGFNAVVMDAFFGGLTSYPSQVSRNAGLPAQYPEMNTDMMAEASKHADRLGLMLYAGVDVALLGRHSAGAISLVRRKHPDWLAQARSGGYVLHDGPEPDAWFLCPANHEVRDFVSNIAHELAEAYRIDGLFVDYLRFPLRALFPETAFCFCESCCQNVASDLGFDLEKMPMELDDPDYQRWTRWRSEQLTRLLVSIRSRTQKARSALRIIVNTPGGYDSDILKRQVMHDWVDWVKEGLANLVALRYSSQAQQRPELSLSKDVAQAPACSLLYSAISLRDFEQNFVQLRAAREAGLAGFFYLLKPGLTRDQAREIAPYLRPEAVPVERDIVQSAVYYLDRAAEDAANQPQIKEYLGTLRSQLLAPGPLEADQVNALARQLEQKRQEYEHAPEAPASTSFHTYLAIAARLLCVYETL